MKKYDERDIVPLNSRTRLPNLCIKRTDECDTMGEIVMPAMAVMARCYDVMIEGDID